MNAKVSVREHLIAATHLECGFSSMFMMAVTEFRYDKQARRNLRGENSRDRSKIVTEDANTSTPVTGRRCGAKQESSAHVCSAQSLPVAPAVAGE